MLERDLKPHEKLFLDRMRRYELIAAAAKRWGVPYEHYRLWEKGTRKNPPRVKLRGMNPHEHYTVMRLRHGLTRKELARRMGIMRRTLWEAEHGRLKTLERFMEFWGDA